MTAESIYMDASLPISSDSTDQNSRFSYERKTVTQKALGKLFWRAISLVKIQFAEEGGKLWELPVNSTDVRLRVRAWLAPFTPYFFISRYPSSIAHLGLCVCCVHSLMMCNALWPPLYWHICVHFINCVRPICLCLLAHSWLLAAQLSCLPRANNQCLWCEQRDACRQEKAIYERGFSHFWHIAQYIVKLYSRPIVNSSRHPSLATRSKSALERELMHAWIARRALYTLYTDSLEILRLETSSQNLAVFEKCEKCLWRELKIDLQSHKYYKKIDDLDNFKSKKFNKHNSNLLQ